MTLQDYAEQASNIEVQIRKLQDKLNPLKELLVKKGPANYITSNGIVQVVKTDESILFNTKQFKEENPSMYQQYFNQVRKGSTSVKFILPKEPGVN